MTPRVQIAQADQTPASTAAVKRLHDLGRGVVVVYPTPGRGGEGIARDVLQALGKRFRDRTPRDPRRLEVLAVLWLRAERVAELLLAAADRRPEDDWMLLRRLCGETGTRLTMIVEQPASDHHVAALGGDVRELTLAELVAETPVMPEDPWGLFDKSGSPDDRPGYPPVPDVDFALFPSACTDVLLQYDAGWAVRTFDQARRATMLWLELRRRGIDERHGPSPRHAHAFLDTLVAPCVTVDAAITFLRGAQAAFLLDGILLEIDADAFAVDHERHAGAPATTATAMALRSYPEPQLAAAGALACATRANPAQIAGLTLAAVTPRRRQPRERPPHRAAVPAAAGRTKARPPRRRRRRRRASVPSARWHAARRRTSRSKLSRADQSRDQLAVRHHLRMEPIHNPRVGNLSPARDPSAHRALSQRSRTAPGLPGCRPADKLDRYRTSDDRAVEALLASVHEPCTAHQLACGLRWTVERTIDALRRLEANLATTGQTVERVGHHTYALAARPGIVTGAEVARCVRHDRKPLDLAAASVLHRALIRPGEERARDALRSPAENAAVARLIAAGLLEEKAGVLWPTQRAETTFAATPR